MSWIAARTTIDGDVIGVFEDTHEAVLRVGYVNSVGEDDNPLFEFNTGDVGNMADLLTQVARIVAGREQVAE